MALSHRQELRHSQTLVMTPQLQQAIKLLQLSSLELAAYIETEFERNPLLERADAERDGLDGTGGEDDRDSGEESGGTEAAPADAAQWSESDSLPSADDAPLDIDHAASGSSDDAMPGDTSFDSAYGADQTTWQSRSRGSDDGGPNIEQTASDDIDLKQHLTSQLNVDVDDPIDRVIGVNLIDMLDESGYLVGDLETVVERVGCDVARIEATLAVAQQFDPPGIFARTLAECLALQLKDRDRLDPAMQAMLDNLDLVAERNIPALIKVCGVDAEDVTDMIAEIRGLNPKPGLAFQTEVIRSVVPDVFVRRGPDGGWLIELNSNTLPRILVNRSYHARINGTAGSQAEKSFVAEHLNSANWLVKSLDQRANTILKVATDLVLKQDAFFLYGVEYLRPLNLRDIAQAIEMHESTVSRVTANKYMATPRGIYPMKYFFTSAIASSAGGEAHSAEAVRHRIRELIDSEPANAVQSDDKIVEALHGQGVDIARRTVAKYREAMRIPSSVERRRLKRHLATSTG